MGNFDNLRKKLDKTIESEKAELTELKEAKDAAVEAYNHALNCINDGNLEKEILYHKEQDIKNIKAQGEKHADNIDKTLKESQSAVELLDTKITGTAKAENVLKNVSNKFEKVGFVSLVTDKAAGNAEENR